MIEAALHASADISTWIGEHHPAEVPDTPRSLLAGSYFAICMDHREAILLLVAHDARSAAFALWRSVYEALISGQWAARCAKDADFAAIAKNKAVPKLETMVTRLDAMDNDPGATSFRRSKSAAWDDMSGFAHSGVVQLARWADSKSGIGPRHPDDEVVKLIHVVNVYGLLACMHVSDIAGNDTTPHIAMIDEVLRRVGARP